MRKWLNTYFDLSRREFNGLMVMTVLVFLISILPGLYHLVSPDLEDIPAEQLAVYKLTSMSIKPRGEKRRQLFYFDPNIITSEQWQKLGLSEKQASSVLKYRAKGGSFKSARDLKKMYTISPEVYARIAPYVRITSVAGRRETKNENFSSVYLDKERSKAVLARSAVRHAPMIEINQADSLKLIEIKGIGPAFARRILRYREKLGGFYKKEQLREVYGLDSTKYEEIKTQVKINPLLIKKIDINSATFELLKNCPYLKYKQINAIIQYRMQHGNYRSVEDMKQIAILNTEVIEQLAPYLVF